MRNLGEQEQYVINALAIAWNGFLALPERHKWDKVEFLGAIHAAQNIILSRPAMETQDAAVVWNKGD